MAAAYRHPRPHLRRLLRPHLVPFDPLLPQPPAHLTTKVEALFTLNLILARLVFN